MWVEILPSFAIISVLLAVPHFSAYAINKLVVGNMYRRSLLNQEQKGQYLRDLRLSGNAYVPYGLEAIPDE